MHTSTNLWKRFLFQSLPSYQHYLQWPLWQHINSSTSYLKAYHLSPLIGYLKGICQVRPLPHVLQPCHNYLTDSSTPPAYNCGVPKEQRELLKCSDGLDVAKAALPPVYKNTILSEIILILTHTTNYLAEILHGYLFSPHGEYPKNIMAPTRPQPGLYELGPRIHSYLNMHLAWPRRVFTRPTYCL